MLCCNISNNRLFSNVHFHGNQDFERICGVLSNLDERRDAPRFRYGSLTGDLARHHRRHLMKPLLQIQNLALGYHEVRLFHQLSFDIERRSTLAVLGANGSGKSTFVRAILGLVQPTSGQLLWPEGRPKEIGYLSQMTEFDSRFPLRVRDLVAMGAWRGLGLWSSLDRASRSRVEAALDDVGIQSLADAPLHILSGGQLQRTLFARVMMQDAPLILLDEPFTAIDQNTEAHLLTIIKRWRDEGRAVVLVVHDLSSVLDHCNNALLLGRGKASYGGVEDIAAPDRLVAQGYLSRSQADWMFGSRVASVNGRV